MSDSESDSLPSNVFTFQNENTMISAKGPGINSNNITNLSFRNNVLTSTMHMPRNFERQRYGEQSFDTRSLCYRRETSPMSMYSGSDMRTRNFHQSYYGGGMSSQRSMYYGRSGSPMSMRSMDSNASVSAADIAMAFKNINFNKHDLRMIKDAYNKFMKRRIRKKIEKRRNMRLFLKGYRHKSGFDSGEQGSDSSISSDDCKSTSSAMYKDNMSCRSTRTDLSDFRRTIRDSTMYRDCTDNFKQNAFKNMFSMPSSSANFSRDRFNVVQNPSALPEKEFAVPKQPFTQKERFKNGYLLPSQRFNKSVASVPIIERDPRLRNRQNDINSKTQTNNEVSKPSSHNNGENESDQEEIFSEVTVREKSSHNVNSQYDNITDLGKRPLETEDSNRCSDRKRPKLSSPIKLSNKANDLLKENKIRAGPKENKTTSDKNDNEIKESNKNDNVQSKNNKKNEDFEFIKPQFPVRKSGPARPKEKLISKSAQPLIDEIIPQNKPDIVEPKATEESQPLLNEEQPEQNTTQHSNTDLSMRPSFIKRKLFTQKMDVTEKKNLSCDNLNSPQTNVYSAIQKEKHKARKLVTNQSCLSRDIAQEGNNLLDLIHKIVPPDRINVTNVSNKTSISTSVSGKNAIDDDKWDVTSVISTCNNDDCSDTYTDEDIFGIDVSKNKNNSNNKNIDLDKPKENNNKRKINVKSQSNNTKTNNQKATSECRILVEKLPQNKLITKPADEAKTIVPTDENGNDKKSVYNRVKSFWDTDFESDLESPAPKRTICRNEVLKENLSKSIVVAEPKIPKNNKLFNISLISVSESIKSKTMPTNNLLKKFNISKTLSIKSFLTPKQVKSKPKIVNETNKGIEIPIAEEPKNTSNELDKKKSVKQTKPAVEEPPKHISTASEKKKPVKQNKNMKPNKAEPKNTNKINNDVVLNKTSKSTKSQPKTKTKEIEAKKTEPKKADSRKKDNLNTTSKTSEEQTKMKGKVAKPQEKPNENISVNKPTAGRPVRTPKRKACCDETDHDDNTNSRKPCTTKSSGSKAKQKNNSNKKTKLDDNNTTQVRSTRTNNTSVNEVKKSNDSLAKKTKSKDNRNNKKVEVDSEMLNNFVEEKINRTLRSRRIDLSSTINSSTENVTLQIRNLRTRRVDLSNSLKDSSFDETIKKAPRTNAVSKKVASKLNHTEIVSKKSRSARNRTLK